MSCKIFFKIPDNPIPGCLLANGSCFEYTCAIKNMIYKGRWDELGD